MPRVGGDADIIRMLERIELVLKEILSELRAR